MPVNIDNSVIFWKLFSMGHLATSKNCRMAAIVVAIGAMRYMISLFIGLTDPKTLSENVHRKHTQKTAFIQGSSTIFRMHSDSINLMVDSNLYGLVFFFEEENPLKIYPNLWEAEAN
jgi:hypothetical protein